MKEVMPSNSGEENRLETPRPIKSVLEDEKKPAPSHPSTLLFFESKTSSHRYQHDTSNEAVELLNNSSLKP
jgi:hypothetical protein